MKVHESVTCIFCFVVLTKATQPRGTLPLVGTRHAPINRPLFYIDLSPNTAFFTTLHPMTPSFAFLIKNFLRNHQILNNFVNCSKNIKTIVKIAKILCIPHPMPSLFGPGPQWPLFRKKIVTDSPLIWCVGRRTHVTLIRECPPRAHSLKF